MDEAVFALVLCVLLVVIGGGAGAFVGLILFALRGASTGTARGTGTRADDPTWTDDDEIAARHHH